VHKATARGHLRCIFPGRSVISKGLPLISFVQGDWREIWDLFHHALRLALVQELLMEAPEQELETAVVRPRASLTACIL
jgi:hypothetical protein